MVDVGEKPITLRECVARGAVPMAPATLAAITEGRTPKGDVLAVARIAGLQAAKRTAEWIPLAHPLPLDAVEIELRARSGRLAARDRGARARPRPHRRRDGGARRRRGGGAHRLRHVQGDRPRHEHRRGAARAASAAARAATGRARASDGLAESAASARHRAVALVGGRTARLRCARGPIRGEHRRATRRRSCCHCRSSHAGSLSPVSRRAARAEERVELIPDEKAGWSPAQHLLVRAGRLLQRPHAAHRDLAARREARSLLRPRELPEALRAGDGARHRRCCPSAPTPASATPSRSAPRSTATASRPCTSPCAATRTRS